MALGGGNWTEQSKILGGAYINFTSNIRGSTSGSTSKTATSILSRCKLGVMKLGSN